MRTLAASSIAVVGSCCLLLALLPEPTLAYIGPGAGISIVGSIVGVLATIFFAIVGFIWYPIRRLLKKRKAKLQHKLAAEQQAVEAAEKEEHSVQS